MKVGRWIVGALLVGVAGWGAYAARGRTLTRPVAPAADSAPAPLPVDTAARAPGGVRVRVRLVNATGSREAVRRATHQLRDLGYDVVEVVRRTTPVDSSEVLDLSGHPEWARRAARAVNTTRVRSAPDSSRYLDLTVTVGRAWRAPTEALDP